jgi:hypothetical protein
MVNSLKIARWIYIEVGAFVRRPSLRQTKLPARTAFINAAVVFMVPATEVASFDFYRRLAAAGYPRGWQYA